VFVTLALWTFEPLMTRLIMVRGWWFVVGGDDA
jgi:hypothetical protein